MANGNQYTQQYLNNYLAQALAAQQPQYTPPDYDINQYTTQQAPQGSPDFSDVQAMFGRGMNSGTEYTPLAGALSGVTYIIDAIMQRKAAKRQQAYNENRQQQLAQILASQDPIKMATSGDPQMAKLGQILLQQQASAKEKEMDDKYRYDALAEQRRAHDLTSQNAQANLMYQLQQAKENEERRIREVEAKRQQNITDNLSNGMSADERYLLFQHPELAEALIPETNKSIFGIRIKGSGNKTKLDKSNALVQELLASGSGADKGIKIKPVG